MSDEDEKIEITSGSGEVIEVRGTGGVVSSGSSGISGVSVGGTYYPSTTTWPSAAAMGPIPAAAPAGRKSKIREAGKMLRAGRAGRMLLVALDEDGKSLWAAQAKLDDLDLGFDDEDGVRVSLTGRFTEEPTFMDKDD